LKNHKQNIRGRYFIFVLFPFHLRTQDLTLESPDQEVYRAGLEVDLCR